MHHQFRYALLLLALALFGSASLGYSQDADKEAHKDPNSAEQFNAEPNPSETRLKKLEDQFDVLQREFKDIKTRPNDLESLQTNWFQTFVIIFLPLAILAFVIVIFLGLRMVRQQRRRSDKITQGLGEKLDESVQRLQKSLDYVRQVGRDNAEKLKETESKQSLISEEQKNTHNAIAEIRKCIDNLESDGEDDTIDYQPEVELIVQEAQAQVAKLVRAYREGEPIDLGHIETPTPSQKVLMILNSLARNLRQWKTESEQSGQAAPKLIETLTYRENDIRDKLKEIRGNFPPPSKPFHVHIDAALNEIRNQCAVDVARFEGMLSGYEQGREVDLAEYNQFIPQFIKDRLFNGVARFVPFDQLPEQLDKFLELVGYEMVPIEVDKTKADSRIHDIQSSRQADVEPGSIVEVVLPGLRRITDGEIVQKPVVIRGE